MRSTTPFVRILAFATVLIMISSTAWASHRAGDDAGTYADAGNTQATATVLPAWGSYSGYLASKDPTDWYRVDEASSAPRCVTATMKPENNATMQLIVATGSTTYSNLVVVPANTTGAVAFAVPALAQTWFNTSAAPNKPGSGDPSRPGHYDFTLSSQVAPPARVLGMTDDDAGNTLGSATPLPGNCFAGRSDPLTGLGDAADVYAFTLTAGQDMVYTFAQNGAAPLELRLLDSTGTPVGSSIATGGIGTYRASSSGTYYLSVVRTESSAEAASYLIGVIGPDPGSPCRPNC